MEFSEGINVLIGRNGSGKTNALDGLIAGLSFVFAGDLRSKKRKDREEPNPLFTNGYSSLVRFDQNDALLSDRIFQYPIKISADAEIFGEKLNWELEKRSEKSQISSSGFKSALATFLSISKANEDKFPVLAFYADGFPHVISRVSSRISSPVNNSDPLPRFLAYHDWNTQTSNANQWISRFIMANNRRQDIIGEGIYLAGKVNILKKHLKEAQESGDPEIKKIEEDLGKAVVVSHNHTLRYTNFHLQGEISFVESKLKTFSQPLRSEFDFVNKEFQIGYIHSNRTIEKANYDIELEFYSNRSIRFSQLPMGYKRLFSIVIDLAYRSYTLNGFSEPEGIVVIDEVELHLHPSLAQEVLGRFRKTFPKIQFIVSTHSPLVISNLEKENGANQVIKLSFDGREYQNEILDNMYGADYEISLSEVMDAGYRIPELDHLINAYILYTKKGKSDDAKRVMAEIEETVGGNSVAIKREISVRLNGFSKE